MVQNIKKCILTLLQQIMMMIMIMIIIVIIIIIIIIIIIYRALKSALYITTNKFLTTVFYTTFFLHGTHSVVTCLPYIICKDC